MQTIPGRHAQQREPRIAPTTHLPARATKGPIVAGITSQAYRKLKHIDHLLINMIDLFAHSDDATIIERDYYELIDIAARVPGLRTASVIPMLHRLRDRRVLDFDLIISDEQCVFLIAPWKYRKLLAQRLGDEITRRRIAHNKARREQSEETVAA